MYGVILVIYCSANNPAEKHASLVYRKLHTGSTMRLRNVVTILRLTNQRRKHRILRTTIRRRVTIMLLEVCSRRML